jgi:exodeoxyribonuclease X
MKLIIIDTETSDLDPAKGAELLEVAWIELMQNDSGVWEPTFHTDMRVCFNGTISPHARAVHHIDPKRLTLQEGAHNKGDVIQHLIGRIVPHTYMVAHMAEFDSKFFPLINGPWICTLKCSKHIWPNAPGHGNQVLRYWLDVHINNICPEVINRRPHEALYDVATTTGILLLMLENHTPEQLWQMTQTPVRLQKINFGKHKGTPFDQLPKDYLNWLASKNDWDDNTMYTIQQILKGNKT